MLTLHFVRHGNTEQSSDGVFCGDLDPPLTDTGLAQAEKLAKFTQSLKPTALYVSPKLRARMTAAPTAKATGLEPRIFDGLREISYGSWEGRHETEIAESEPKEYAAWVGDPALVSPPGGEGAFAIAARALPVLIEIKKAHVEGHVIVVSHKATIRVMTCALLGLHLGRFRDRVGCPTASTTTFEFGSRGAMLISLGDTHYLG